MVADPRNSGDARSYLREKIRATEKKLQELQASGADEKAIRSVRGELDALRKLPPEARVFLQGSGEDDSVIIGFSMPEDPISATRDPGGAA